MKQRTESMSLQSRLFIGVPQAEDTRTLWSLPMVLWLSASPSLREMETAQPGCWDMALGQRTWKFCSFLPHCCLSKGWCLGKGAVWMERRC